MGRRTPMPHWRFRRRHERRPRAGSRAFARPVHGRFHGRVHGRVQPHSHGHVHGHAQERAHERSRACLLTSRIASILTDVSSRILTDAFASLFTSKAASRSYQDRMANSGHKTQRDSKPCLCLLETCARDRGAWGSKYRLLHISCDFILTTETRRHGERLGAWFCRSPDSRCPPCLSASVVRCGIPGGLSGGATPDPIPNSVVKPSCADGTWAACPGRVGRRRDKYGEPPRAIWSLGVSCFGL